MTHQEMIDHVAQELRNTRIETKITGWLNRAITYFGSQYLFGHLNKYFNKNTSDGIPFITMDADYHWLKTIQIPADNIKLYPINEATLAEEEPRYRTLKGTTTHYYKNGFEIGLWQVPGAAVKVITGSYQKRGAVLLANKSVVCDLPEEWHEIVCQNAIYRGYKYEGDKVDADSAKAQEAFMLKKIGATVYKQPDDRPILGENSSRRGRPARPRLPYPYPQPRY